ncbi:probable ribonuclease ZC3H12C isoform X2 [Manduca sexta]|uniref:probable ribonuclease ZC3H12C isoform X2 n=1 Tax=Manduca sexta TaxID=7130 RepID=UPI0011841AE2|nr:probable ribonuclease ZC3H12C isoform X2 [Manduca sexta]
MGKPSSSSLARKSVSKSKSKMNIMLPKMKASNRKIKRRRNKTIKNIFMQLRSESDASENISQNISIISLDNSLHNSTETLNDRPSKRTLSPSPGNRRKRQKSDSVIILNDEDLIINEGLCPQTPKKPSTIQCSTPIINKDSKTLSELIVNTFPKNNSSTIINLNKDINLTKQINRDSYLTIDLTDGNEASGSVNKTASTNDTKESENTVIDLVNTTDLPDCSIISVTKPDVSEHSLSGESDVTVLRKPQQSSTKQMRKIANGIAQLDSMEKGKLLEFITEKIFNGCNMPKHVKKSLTSIKDSITTNSDENDRIKKILLGQSPSRNSVGSNIYHPDRGNNNKSGLRMIVIDGSNVAMEHGKGKVFSVAGLKICIDYFLKRGHRVKAFVPRFRCKYGKSTDPRLLDHLERQGMVVYTPSREIKGKTITPYDDRYIIQCAAEFDGVIVTGDNYRDLADENSKWRFVIENRLLPFTWVDDMIMFPKDPLGRNGPTLQKFLSH